MGEGSRPVAAAALPSPDGGFAARRQQVSGFDNVAAEFTFLPEVWAAAERRSGPGTSAPSNLRRVGGRGPGAAA